MSLIFFNRLTQLGVQQRELIDVLAGVAGVGYAVAELEVEGFEELVPEVVALDHAELVHWPGTHRELYPEAEYLPISKNISGKVLSISRNK